MLKERWSRILIRATGALLVGALAFASSSSVSTKVQAGKQQIFTVDDLEQLQNEESRKPPFVGEIAGVTFQSQVSASNMGCPDSADVENVPSSAVSSPLLFQTQFLSSEFEWDADNYVSVCDGKAIAYARRAIGKMQNGKQKEVYVARFAGRFVVSEDRRERFHTVTVGGKPAILIKGLPIPGTPRGDDPHRWRLVIVEDFGITLIDTRWVQRPELLKMAEALK